MDVRKVALEILAIEGYCEGCEAELEGNFYGGRHSRKEWDVLGENNPEDELIAWSEHAYYFEERDLLLGNGVTPDGIDNVFIIFANRCVYQSDACSGEIYPEKFYGRSDGWEQQLKNLHQKVMSKQL